MGAAGKDLELILEFPATNPPIGNNLNLVINPHGTVARPQNWKVIMKFIVGISYLFFSAIAWQCLAQSVLEMSEVRYGELREAGFQLRTEKEIRLEALGAGVSSASEKRTSRFYDPHQMYSYAWIIDAATRQPVWVMSYDNTWKADDGESSRQFAGPILLPRGRYEVYFFARKPSFFDTDDEGLPSLGRLLRRLLRGDDWRHREPENYFVRCEGVDKVYSSREVRLYQDSLRAAATISISGVLDSESREVRFSLTAPGDFQIYALGEALDDGLFDYGWIVREQDGSKVWGMVDEHSEYAGGAIKNRVWKDVVHLEPGNYTIRYVTDDSHSPEGWNANPPYDPFFWGITLQGIRGRYQPKSVTRIGSPQAVEILNLTRVGDDAFLTKRFELASPLTVRILSLGEGVGDRMVDYGWISDARTGATIWEMSFRNTRHAGGASKNREVEDRLLLSPGLYAVYFVSDDSHSFKHWNATPPRNASRWGITLSAVTADFDPKSIRYFSDLPEFPLVDIRAYGSRERLQRDFRLEKAGRLHLTAAAEGENGELFTYGWIEDRKSGKKVWNMDFDQTHFAGGRRQNRFVDLLLDLPAGEYSAFYVTGSWSRSRSDDRYPGSPESRSFTISLLNEGGGRGQPENPETSGWEDVPFVSLTRVQSDRVVFSGFQIDSNTPVRIVALGEGSGGDMYDYGWIINTATGRKAWEMRYGKTRNAGGAGKNRLSEDVVYLSGGKYMVYFRTDDSHAYGDWNASPPDQPENWGIQLYAAKGFQKNHPIKLFQNLKQSGQVICQIIHVGDDDRISKEFRLSTPARLRIYAIGEGSDGEMYDYGWIENRASREVVWIMNYDLTEWAGGAHKNRSVVDFVDLPAGEYLLFYVTDDSHSPEDWNSRPPDDRENYGITVSLVE